MALSDIVAGAFLCAGIIAVIYDLVATHRSVKSSES